MKKKKILTEEQKAQNKIYKANWYQENKAQQKINQKEWAKKNPNYIPPCRIENPDYYKKQSKRFRKANPGYNKEWQAQHDLGYWIVYIIHDYNGLNDDYCGQTQNIYMRMAQHKSDGRLNTDTYTIVKKCDTLEDALELESAVHNFGYHGSVSTESGK